MSSNKTYCNYGSYLTNRATQQQFCDNNGRTITLINKTNELEDQVDNIKNSIHDMSLNKQDTITKETDISIGNLTVYGNLDANKINYKTITYKNTIINDNILTLGLDVSNNETLYDTGFIFINNKTDASNVTLYWDNDDNAFIFAKTDSSGVSINNETLSVNRGELSNLHIKDLSSNNTYTKNQVDKRFNAIDASFNDVYNKAEITAIISDVSDNIYTRAQLDVSFNAIDTSFNDVYTKMNTYVEYFTFGLTSYDNLEKDTFYYLVPGGDICPKDVSGHNLSNNYKQGTAYAPSIGNAYGEITIDRALLTLSKRDDGSFSDNWGNSGSVELKIVDNHKNVVGLSCDLSTDNPFKLNIPENANITGDSISVLFKVTDIVLDNGFHINLTLRTTYLL